MEVAVQGFSIREELGRDFEETLSLLKSLGFKAYEMGLYTGEDNPRMAREVQSCIDYFGSLPGCIWSVPEAEKKIHAMRGKGLEIESCHIFFCNAYETALSDNLDRLIDFGVKNSIKQYVVSFALDSWEAAESRLDQLSFVSKALEGMGIHMAYHNHDKEMAAAGEITVLEKLLDAVPTLSLQPDIGWMQAGKGPVERIIKNCSDRIYSIHFKDLLLDPDSLKGGIVCTPVGQGDVDHQFLSSLIGKMPLLSTGLIIDQDNARGNMLDELKQGQEYIINQFIKEN